jgi:hypothetical protein
VKRLSAFDAVALVLAACICPAIPQVFDIRRQPVIFSTRPSAAEVGAPGQTLIVSGPNMEKISTIQWNGQDRLTQWLNTSEASISLTAADLAAPGLVAVTYSTAGMVSKPIYFAVTIAVQSNGIIYDAKRETLWISVAGSDPRFGNQVVPIDTKGRLGKGIFVGSEPGRMAISDDASFLYVALDGAAAVRRVDLKTLTADLQFSLGRDAMVGNYYARDIAVMPGQPHTVAVARKCLNRLPASVGVAIYDDGVMRKRTTLGYCTRLQWSDSPTVIIGMDTESSYSPLQLIHVESDGVSSEGSLLAGLGSEFHRQGDRLYGTSGAVADAHSGKLIGTYSFNSFFNLGQASGVVSNRSTGRAYFCFGEPVGGSRFAAFDLDTFTLAGTWRVPGFVLPPVSTDVLAPWGKDGLASRGKDHLLLFHPPPENNR